jgi:hypothetical protein
MVSQDPRRCLQRQGGGRGTASTASSTIRSSPACASNASCRRRSSSGAPPFVFSNPLILRDTSPSNSFRSTASDPQK